MGKAEGWSVGAVLGEFVGKWEGEGEGLETIFPACAFLFLIVWYVENGES